MDWIKSLLRYPGGKSRAVKIITQYIPKDIKVLCSPFFGGGSIELYLDSKGINVYGYDYFLPLVEFWQCVLDNAYYVSKLVEKYYPINKETFKELQQNYDKYKTKEERAAIFYVLNRCSFSGSTLAGGMSKNHPRFNSNSIKRLREFKAKNVSVEHMDFEDSIKKHKNDFLYCDPPYWIESRLYGQKGILQSNFDHIRLYNCLKSHDNWILSYNDCEVIRNLYNKYKIIELNWKYGMNKSKRSNEILILNIK